MRLRSFERLCFAGGFALLLTAGLVYLDALLGSRVALAAFEEARLEYTAPDQSDWSEARRKAFAATLTREGRVPLAVLEIPAVNLEVPVFSGTDRWALNRGAGHLETTPLPGQSGNSAIAGHRDGFFRSLQRVEPGDRIRIRTLDGVSLYRVDKLHVVDPLDVSVLESSDQPSLTLITCFPFYFVGAAPDRYIVRAVREEQPIRNKGDQNE